MDQKLSNRVSLLCIGKHVWLPSTLYISNRLVARYCFVEFNDAIAARQALERLNGQFIPGTSAVSGSYTCLTALLNLLSCPPTKGQEV